MNSDTHIDLTTADGGLIGRLRRSVLTIVAEAEHSARASSLSKSTAISQAITKEIKESGYNIAPDSLAEVCRTVELIRRSRNPVLPEVVLFRMPPNLTDMVANFGVEEIRDEK